MLEFIRYCEEHLFDPVDPGDLTTFIDEKFNVQYSRSWAAKWAKTSEELHLVSATPMEDERIDVTEEQLEDNFYQLSESMVGVDPRLLLNIDECGWGKMLNQGVKKVISLNNAPTRYRQKSEPGHITFIPVSWCNGDFSRAMMIINSHF